MSHPSPPRTISVFVRSQSLRTSPVDFRGCEVQMQTGKTLNEFIQQGASSGKNNRGSLSVIGSILSDLCQCDSMEGSDCP